MLHDPLADAISAIRNAERAGKKDCIISKNTKLIREILSRMQETGYLEKFEVIDSSRGGKIKATLSGKINDCKAIVPRFFVKKDAYVQWEKQFLPASGVGILLVSTSKGLVSHKDVRGKLGGSLVAYVY
ncbi:MAG: 30S ribosomal protein S8 [Nanoarchaeota archaeon]|nr:30S ribosomal protein S8 [Nanoarchaeota archaeon]MBU4300772.1 30S ribosomal protein S8 [Nanoarchaeota archaeon]MBU4452360.1 30S ribosomal protein S8 [Nanoarchaeota archaeon]MCG2723364.1 30S ribosomal protein S8 [archaeon]